MVSDNSFTLQHFRSDPSTKGLNTVVIQHTEKEKLLFSLRHLTVNFIPAAPNDIMSSEDFISTSKRSLGGGLCCVSQFRTLSLSLKLHGKENL